MKKQNTQRINSRRLRDINIQNNDENTYIPEKDLNVINSPQKKQKKATPVIINYLEQKGNTPKKQYKSLADMFTQITPAAPFIPLEDLVREEMPRAIEETKEEEKLEEKVEEKSVEKLEEKSEEKVEEIDTVKETEKSGTEKLKNIEKNSNEKKKVKDITEQHLIGGTKLVLEKKFSDLRQVLSHTPAEIENPENELQEENAEKPKELLKEKNKKSKKNNKNHYVSKNKNPQSEKKTENIQSEKTEIAENPKNEITEIAEKPKEIVEEKKKKSKNPQSENKTENLQKEKSEIVGNLIAKFCKVEEKKEKSNKNTSKKNQKSSFSHKRPFEEIRRANKLYMEKFKKKKKIEIEIKEVKKEVKKEEKKQTKLRIEEFNLDMAELKYKNSLKKLELALILNKMNSKDIKKAEGDLEIAKNELKLATMSFKLIKEEERKKKEIKKEKEEKEIDSKTTSSNSVPIVGLSVQKCIKFDKSNYVDAKFGLRKINKSLKELLDY